MLEINQQSLVEQQSSQGLLKKSSLIAVPVKVSYILCKDAHFLALKQQQELLLVL